MLKVIVDRNLTKKDGQFLSIENATQTNIILLVKPKKNIDQTPPNEANFDF